jgi:FKBP-type peptidyl-prolyl cis-trans isomerase FkpA
MRIVLLIAGMLLFGNMPLFSQQTPPDFIKLPSGLAYKIVKDKKGKKTAKPDDYVYMHLVRKGNGNILFDSRALNNNEPVPYPVKAPQFAGDPAEVIGLLTAGDSAVILVPMDSMIKAGMQMHDTSYKTQEMLVSVVAVKTPQEIKEEAEKKTAKQKKIDDKKIRKFLKANNITASKTASGLYYKIDRPGAGDTIKAGQTAQVMYIGKLLDGSIFDANMGSDPKHTEPISVMVGKGQVIKGWDEGLLLLKKGTRASFYIPSPLAYGSQSPGAAIPPNSVLIFDVEIRDVQ